MKNKGQNQMKHCLLWAQVGNFIYCKGWLFHYITFSFANIYHILSYYIYFIWSLTSQCSITWLKDLRSHDMA